MSSRLKTERDCIEHLAKLGSRDWQRFTTNISWLHRRDEMTEADVPAKLVAITEQLLDPDEWRRIRIEVSRLRRQLYRQRAKEERSAKIERRRDYMRAYMAKYRSKL